VGDRLAPVPHDTGDPAAVNQRGKHMNATDRGMGFARVRQGPAVRGPGRPTVHRWTRDVPLGEAPALRVLLCEGHEVYRIGLRTILEDSHDLAVVGEAVSMTETLALADRVRPNVVVLGLGGPDHETVDLVGELTRSAIGVVVLAESSDCCALALLGAGARGYLLRPTASVRLPEAVRAVARSESLLDATAADSVQQLLSSPVPLLGGWDPLAPSGSPATRLGEPHVTRDLTSRQREVVSLVAEGLSNAEIAGRLHLGEATVKSHLAAVMRKYSLRDRTQLAIMIIRSGLDQPRAAAS